MNNFIYKLILYNNNSYCELKAFLDTGNLLKDNLTKLPITIVDYNSVKNFFSINITDILLNRTDSLNKTLKNAHLMEINSVGGSKKIIVFQIDKLEILLNNNNHIIKDACIGLSIKSFINDLGYNALMGPELLNCKE